MTVLLATFEFYYHSVQPMNINNVQHKSEKTITNYSNSKQRENLI